MLLGILEVLLSNGSQSVVLMVAPGILSWEEPKKEWVGVQLVLMPRREKLFN